MAAGPAKSKSLSIRSAQQSGYAVVFRNGIVASLIGAALIGIGTLVGAGIALGRLSPLMVSVLAIGAFFRWVWVWLAASKDTFSAFKDVATIIGIGAGIWWFFKRRQHRPRLDVSLTISHHALDDDRMLVAIGATLKNHGVLPVRIVRATAFIQQVSPPSAETLASIKERAPHKPVNQPEIPWESLEACECDPVIEIEPGETDHYLWDFIAYRSVRTLRAYVRFDNEQRGGRGQLGWNATTLYDVADDSDAHSTTPTQPTNVQLEPDMSNHDGKFRKGSLMP